MSWSPSSPGQPTAPQPTSSSATAWYGHGEDAAASPGPARPGRLQRPGTELERRLQGRLPTPGRPALLPPHTQRQSQPLHPAMPRPEPHDHRCRQALVRVGVSRVWAARRLAQYSRTCPGNHFLGEHKRNVPSLQQEIRRHDAMIGMWATPGPFVDRARHQQGLGPAAQDEVVDEFRVAVIALGGQVRGG